MKHLTCLSLFAVSCLAFGAPSARADDTSNTLFQLHAGELAGSSTNGGHVKAETAGFNFQTEGMGAQDADGITQFGSFKLYAEGAAGQRGDHGQNPYLGFNGGIQVQGGIAYAPAHASGGTTGVAAVLTLKSDIDAHHQDIAPIQWNLAVAEPQLGMLMRLGEKSYLLAGPYARVGLTTQEAVGVRGQLKIHEVAQILGQAEKTANFLTSSASGLQRTWEGQVAADVYIPMGRHPFLYTGVVVKSGAVEDQPDGTGSRNYVSGLLMVGGGAH